MADKKTVDKVKELLDGHVYAPLKETAEKWLAEADEKYDVKEKAGKAWDKLGEAADSFAESSGKFNEKMNEAGEKFTAGAEKLAEKAGPAVDQLKEKAAPKLDELKEKAAPALDKVSDSELIAKLKEGIATVNETIEHFSDPKVREDFGEEAAEQIKKHAEALKAEGKEFCDCPACTKAREILKDLGVDLEAGDGAEKTAEENVEAEESGE
jgi:uncharacterized phage infection (PIP) family protein YhgE